MTKVVLESPFANENQNIFNDNYFYLCVAARKMMLEKSDAPLFFHALYTQFLNDDIQEERNLGLFKSFEFHSGADNKTYAIDRGISKGMVLGAEDALKKGMDIQFYTALPEESEIGQKIKKINNIRDIEKRWVLGKQFVENLMDNPINKASYQKTGDLTLYTENVQQELKDVKNCILKFFAPLVDSIREEQKNELNNKKRKRRIKIN